jgi:hypothetical protein
VREETIFVALPKEIHRPTYLCVSNQYSNDSCHIECQTFRVKKLFKELFQGITLDDVFDDIISTKTGNNVRGTKTADTLVKPLTDVLLSTIPT